MGLMRFLLAMSVVVWHLQRGVLLIPGGLAVEVFFAISGFYMSLILTGKYRDRTTFYTNRFLRLYPVYFVVSLGTWAWTFVVWAYLGRAPTGFVRYLQMSFWEHALLFINNWTMVGLDIPMWFYYSVDKGVQLFHYGMGGGLTIGPTWSIGLEIWFYLLAPFLVALRSRWIVLMAVLSVALKITMATLHLKPDFFFPAQLCFFLVGILLHRVYADRFVGNFDGRIGWAVLMTVLALFLLYNRIPEPFATYLIYVTFIPAIPILFALTRKNRFDLNLGNLSYPIYVVHSLVLWIAAAVFHHLYGDVNGLKLVMISLVSIGGVLFVSIILYIVIDKPVDEMRQHRLATGRASPQREALQAINVMQQA